MDCLFRPRGIAVVGASQKTSRANGVLTNLKLLGYAGAVYAVNHGYSDVQGFPCVATIADLPDSVELVVIGIAAERACNVLEAAFEHGIKGAVVLASGFGEGGKGKERAARLRALADRGMIICGPNCLGVFNFADGVAAYSRPMTTFPLIAGRTALVTQSGGLGSEILGPLMNDRQLGFSHVISCGNQIGTSVEDYLAYLVDRTDVRVIAVVVESLRDPQKLRKVARIAIERKITLLFLQTGRSAAGQLMVQSHTGALVENSDVFSAFLRRCGIVQIDGYDELIEAIELFSHIPDDDALGEEVVIITGSGGNAAVCADTLDQAKIPLAPLTDALREKFSTFFPAFGTINNPIDATGAIYDDLTLLPKIFDAVLDFPGRPLIAGNVNVRSERAARWKRFVSTFAEVARKTNRTIVAYQYSHLGGPIDKDLVDTLHAGGVPVLLGSQNAMKTLRYVPIRNALWRTAKENAALDDNLPRNVVGPLSANVASSFMGGQALLSSWGIPFVETTLVHDEEQLKAGLMGANFPVVIKIEADGLLHKSDIGCVRTNCADEGEAIAAYREIVANATKGGFPSTSALVQPMMKGVAECYAGILNDPVFGPTISVGLGGIFIEVIQSAETEMAPVTRADALAMISRLKGVAVLKGARGRAAADVTALADLLVGLGRFAVAYRGKFRSLDINPIIVKADGEGLACVDLAIET